MKYMINYRHIKQWFTGESFNIVLILILSITGVICCIRWWHVDVDDSYIVYRIARNVAEHGQWAYNIGEIRNVSTGMLHTLFISVFTVMTSIDPRNISHFLCSLYIIFAGCAAFQIFDSTATSSNDGESQSDKAISVLGAMAVVVFLASNETWGLETNLTIALILWIIVKVINRKSAYYLAGLCILSRPDAIVLLFLLMLYDFTINKQMRKVIYGVIQTIVVMLPWIVFSLIKFGQIAPATLSEKKWQVSSGFWTPISLDLILPYLAKSKFDVFHSNISIALFFCFFAFIGIVVLIKKRSAVLLFPVFAVIQLGAYIFIGVPRYHWYFSYFGAAIFICATCSLIILVKYLLDRRVIRVLSCVTLFLCLFILFPKVKADRLDERKMHYQKLASAMLKIEPNPEKLHISMLEVGTFGYYVNSKMIDLTGLTSVTPEFISGANNDLFFQNKPDYCIMFYPPSSYETELVSDERFTSLFQVEQVVEMAGHKTGIAIWGRIQNM